jgi:nitrile hydratase subunit alpha
MMPTHHHDDHSHNDEPEAFTYHQVMEIAVRELLIEKGVITADEVRRQVEDMDQRTPAMGARVVARAWVDPAYKARLFENANAAVEEIGLERGPYKLLVVENVAEGGDHSLAVHNVIVCTLCSCYPRWLLGLPPDWYKSRDYRSRMVREPRKVLREFGLELSDNVAVRVHVSTADMRYLVLPHRPTNTKGWSEERLASLVTRDCMIGVAVPNA